MPDGGTDTPPPGGEPLYNIAALSVRSRRLPRTSPHDAVLSAVAFSLQRKRYDGENITLGDSREPPANNVCRPDPARDEYVRSPRTCQSGSPPSPGRLHALSQNPSRTRTTTRTRTIGDDEGRYRPYSGATAAGTIMASRIPCTIFLSGGTMVAKTPPRTTSRGETTK
jgi:hypothetical protein